MTKANKTILIIDDSEHISKPLGALLSDSGYVIKIIAKSTDPAILQKPFADVILLDLRLQDGRGEDLCLKIKQGASTRHIPVIMFSADNRLKAKAQEAGADDFIEKPFEMPMLLEKIERQIRKASRNINLPSVKPIQV